MNWYERPHAAPQCNQATRDADSLRDPGAIYYQTAATFGRCMNIFTGILVITYIAIVTRLPEMTPAVLCGSISEKLPRVGLTTCVNTVHPASGGLHKCVSAKLPRAVITARAQIGHTAPALNEILYLCMLDTLSRGALNEIWHSREHTGHTSPCVDTCVSNIPNILTRAVLKRDAALRRARPTVSGVDDACHQ